MFLISIYFYTDPCNELAKPVENTSEGGSFYFQHPWYVTIRATEGKQAYTQLEDTEVKRFLPVRFAFRGESTSRLID